jgi:heparosan-N-sulfate-glucuronate 5-epimerase
VPTPPVTGAQRKVVLGDHYFDYLNVFADIAQGALGPMDADGIPLVDYDRLFRGHPAIDQKSGYGVHYTPVTIAEYALGAWALHRRSSKPELRDCFMRQANWLVAALRTDMGFGVWVHDFAFPHYGLVSPWVSAMAQGLGISVLVRASQLTEDPVYREAATSAFAAFAHGITEGGVSCEENGYLWLEEYPTDPPCHVLNGFIFALLGVLDFLRATGSDEAMELWYAGIRTIRENLPRYEMACWSRYDLLSRQIAAPYYHQVHVDQLRILASLTGDPVFDDFNRRWQGYIDGDAQWRRWPVKKMRGLLRRLGVMPYPPIRGLQSPPQAGSR